MKVQICLRPVKSSQNNLRLGLYTEDFRKYVNSDVSTVFIDLGNNVKQDIEYVTSYVKYGSLVNKHIISDWLFSNGFTTPNHQLLFELEINGNVHVYHFKSAVTCQ